jgi:hypothetical protein
VRKFLVLLTVVAVVFLVWNRQRLYVRDPLGSVMRDGAKEKGVQVYINFSNDVLLQNYNAPMYVELVQQDAREGGARIGTPQTLHCIAYVACLLDADTATLLKTGRNGSVVSMSGKRVEFREGNGRSVVVTLL